MMSCCEELGSVSESSAVVEVLASEFYRDCSETIELFALSGFEKSECESILKFLNSAFPIFPFLKRIHNNRILLGQQSVNWALEKWWSEGMSVGLVKVPKFPVFTKSQYIIANGIWPVRVTARLSNEEESIDLTMKSLFVQKINELISQRAGCSFHPPSNEHAPVFGRVSKGAHFSDHPVLDACEQVSKLSSYLATEYTVFCLSEPCVMCAMALLHSRVKSVVFVADKPSRFGGLGSLVSVHTERKLNHKFRVFKVSLMPDDTI